MVRPGMLISDRYEIIEKVGSGGMADVYKAKCHRLNRYVAIKILKAEYSEDKSFVEKFRGEAQSAARLSHPNIVNVYDVGDDDGLYYIVMELVEGITLKNFIERKGKLEVKEVLGISIQIAQGMEAAHANHIIHRDIKPQNIIISRDGKVKVTDFGIAKAATSNTITSNAMGSVHYISPEQARGGYSDEKSDIYSLGITMYEMLCGRVPFTGDNTISVALLHIQGEAVPLREVDPEIPIALDKIVQKCMQKKPERRYTSVTELIKDLRKAITNPNDDFVKIPPMVINDSPTIHISDDEISHIKSASKEVPNQAVFHETEESETEEELEELEDETEEEDDSDVDPKVEKLMVAGGIIAAIILICIIVFIIAKVVLGGNGKVELPEEPTTSTEALASPEASVDTDGKVSVPKVVGETQSDAEEILSAKNLKVEIETQESTTYENGVVISQDPEDGDEVKEGTIITLVVSKKPEASPSASVSSKVTVKEVRGSSYSNAESALKSAGFRVYKQQVYSDTVDEGNVVKTYPSAGSSVDYGSTVTVYVSKGPEQKNSTVPDLSGMTESQAKSALEKAGLSLGKVSFDYSDNIAKDQVILQSYTVGSSVKQGSSVNITISRGKKEEEKTYKYTSSATISHNPFESDDESGKIEIVLSQSGNTKTVYSEECDGTQFPFSISFEGFDESAGSLQMYLNGTPVGGPIKVTFTKVESK